MTVKSLEESLKSPVEQGQRSWKTKRFLSLNVLLVLALLAYWTAPPLEWASTVYDLTGLESGQALSKSSVCRQPSPAARPSHLSDFVNAPNFTDKAAENLAGAVRIPTMSFDDMGPVDQDPRWEPFTKMHEYLASTFPKIHENLKLTIIGGYSLVYTWEGADTSAKPLMLTGHLDVVPALTALDRWTYPPFSGTHDGEWVYGRGAGDCKNNVIGIMTAVEHLLNADWTPKRTIILAFGQDEEISGPRGATNIGKHLETLYGKNGIAMIVDEGGMGLDKIYGTEFALPGNAEIQVDMLGGHSSVPTPHTSIGLLSKIVSAVEDSDIFQPHLEEKSPIWGYLSCIGRHGDKAEVPGWIQDGVSAKRPDFKHLAHKFAEISPGNRYLVQTSKAATIFHAGLKSNALAESARVLFNSRIDIFSSPQRTKKAYYSLVKPIAEKYSLNVIISDGDYTAPVLEDGEFKTDSIGNVTLIWSSAHVASPISPSNLGSPAWTIFSKAVQAAFGEHVVTAPSAMTGNTDTRFYVRYRWNLSENIYRWSPTRAGTKLNIHTVDEKIKIQTHVEGIKFYTDAPITLREVCRTFYNVVRRTPKIWTHLKLDISPESFNYCLAKSEVWFSMAGDCKVRVEAELHKARLPSNSAQLLPCHLSAYTSQISSLSLRSPSADETQAFISSLYGSASHNPTTHPLQSLSLIKTTENVSHHLSRSKAVSPISLPTFPHLRQLTLTNHLLPYLSTTNAHNLKEISITYPLRFPPLSIFDLRHVLRSSPQLERLELEARITDAPNSSSFPYEPDMDDTGVGSAIGPDTDSSSSQSSLISLPNLTHLHLRINHLPLLLGDLLMQNLDTVKIEDLDGKRARADAESGAMLRQLLVRMELPSDNKRGPGLRSLELVGVGIPSPMPHYEGATGNGAYNIFSAADSFGTWAWCFQRMRALKELRVSKVNTKALLALIIGTSGSPRSSALFSRVDNSRVNSMATLDDEGGNSAMPLDDREALPSLELLSVTLSTSASSFHAPAFLKLALQRPAINVHMDVIPDPPPVVGNFLEHFLL
ncbi:hypothetical protein CVT24_009929 [Panaeolus cyanescens]|uniref:Peptidase M20 dimerisation domain-containing protein n=1 Tax=Panaeolus cyanescens TaxID=181874 RepID=A0A409W421_9AGAR|nr:hypothetical protein CVT24_009929 [Panaeolus cyanescens]